MPPRLDRMIYVDDSGHLQSGLVVYGWVEFAPDRWPTVLNAWLDMRKRLWRDFRIAVPTELHTTDYVNGRGRISKAVPRRHISRGLKLWKDFGREVASECLETLRCTEGLTVGAVYRRGKVEDTAQTRRATYKALVERLERELVVSNSLALMFIDGDGADRVYKETHRSLALRTRRIIEDPIHLDSAASQLIQMADLVAWSAYVAVERFPGQAFAWGWYDKYLAERDLARAPQEI